jgi:hypothetical protein
MELLQHHLPKPKTRYGRKREKSSIIGLEIELEDVNGAIYTAPWSKTEDHSLKLSGYEYTLCLWSHSTQDALDALYAKLGHFSTTKRTSVHVHLNVQDMPLENFKTLIAIYMMYEKALYRYSGYRWENIFCVPLNAFLRHSLFTQKSFGEYIHFWNQDNFKYSGLNLGRLGDLGTVEFRQMKGTSNSKLIQDWVNIIVAIKNYAMDVPFTQFKDVVKTINNSSAYWWLLDTIFKEYASALNYPDYASDIEELTTNVKALIFGADIKQLLTQFNREYNKCVVSYL